MDKSWMMLEDRRRPEYENGVQQFLNFAYSSIEPGESIRCPCRKCNNVYFQNRGDVEADLLQYGTIRNYDTWVLHGEELDESDDEDFDFDEEEDDDQVEEGQDPMNEDEAFIQVFGEEKSSRLRGCGDGLKPFSKRQRINTELEKENEELRKKAEEDSKALETLKEKNKEMALRLESLESQVNNQEAQVQSQVQDFLKSQLPSIIQNLGISGHPLANV